MIQITRLGTVLQGSTPDLARLQDEFQRQHCIRLHSVLEPGLAQVLRGQVHEAEFYERVHEGIGSNRELCMRPNAVGGILQVLFNSEPLFEVLRQITECGPIECFTGRVYRVIPGRGHYDAWHNDVGEHRMLAMSVNLSSAPFAGGLLQIRDRISRRILHEVANTGFGDAIVFRIAHDLQHRISEMEGAASKTAFAGWFQSRPDFRALLRSTRSYPG